MKKPKRMFADLPLGYSRYIATTKMKDRVVTTCIILNQRKIIVSIGVAICSPQDTYNYIRGLTIAKGRALKGILK